MNKKYKSILILSVVAILGYLGWNNFALSYPSIIPPITTIENSSPDFSADLTSTMDLQNGVGKGTFTRATTATVIDFENLIKKVKSGEARFEGARRVENLLTYSEDFSNWFAGSPAVVVTTNQAIAPNGTLTADLLDTNGQLGYQSQSVGSTFPVGTQCLFSIYLRSVSGTGTFPINIYDGSAHHRTYVTLTTLWQRFTLTATVVTVGANACNVYPVDARAGQGSLTQAYAWGGQVENVTGQANQKPSEYVSTNVKTSAPYHGANVDGVKYFTTYNGNTVASNVVTEATGAAIPDATLHGYVAEGARTNLALQSETFDNASWTKDNSSITSNSVVSPAGTLTADTITNNTTNGLHRTYISVGSAAQRTISVYAKQGTASFIGLSPTGLTSNTSVFDLSNGTIASTGSGVTSSITSIGNGWYRCSIKEIASLGTFIIINIGETAVQALPNTSYVGTTKDVYLWGAQAETASFASSYIPTTTASVTRNADVLTYQTSGNFSDTAGSAYAESIAESWTNVAGQYLGDGTESPLQSSASNSGIQSYDGTNTVNGPTGTPSGQKKVASSWTGSTLKAFATGVKGTDGTYDGAFALAQLNIGSSYYGTIRNVKIFKRALSDQQLINLTSTDKNTSLSAIKKTIIRKTGTTTIKKAL